MKKLVWAVSLLLLFQLILAGPLAYALTPPYPGTESQTVHVFVNGQELSFDVAPRVVDGRTLAPMRTVLEALGYSIAWNESTQTVSASHPGGVELVLAIGSAVALVNGQERELEVPAFVIDGRTMIPIRFCSEILGYNVGWDPGSSSAYITTQISSPAGQRSAAEYFPMAVGDKWDLSNGGLEDVGYSEQVLFGSGTYYQNKLEVPGMSWDVVVYEVAADKVAIIYSAMKSGVSASFTTVDAENTDLIKQPGFTGNDRRVILQGPISVGNAWSDNYQDSLIVSTTESVSTPAGVFNNCVKVKRSSAASEMISYDYYAPQVGPVKRDYIMAGQEAFKSSLLEAYTVH